MKKEIDFSKGQRGRFYTRGARLNIPVYLDRDIQRFVSRIADQKQTDVSRVVNQLLKSGMQIAKTIG